MYDLPIDDRTEAERQDDHERGRAAIRDHVDKVLYLERLDQTARG